MARTESPDWTIANTIASRQKACETTPTGCSKYFVERIVVWRKGLGQKLSDSDCLRFASPLFLMGHNVRALL